MTGRTVRPTPAIGERLRALSPGRQRLLAEALNLRPEMPSRGENAGRKALAAFISPRGGPEEFGEADQAQLKGFLRERLPDYMIPGRISVLASLPVLPNGKVDKKALARLGEPEPRKSATTGTAVGGVNEEILTAMQAIWSELLGVDEIYPDDNFFELGGDSLLSINVVSRARKRGIYLGPGELFDYPVLSRLCEHLAEVSGERAADPAGFDSKQIYSGNTGGAAAPFFMVHGSSRLVEQLGDVLGHEQPVHLLPGHWETGNVSHGTSLEELAREALELLREVSPRGPYLLGGLSFGGVIAFEMTQQLAAQGEEVKLLLLLDPPEDPGVFKSAPVDADHPSQAEALLEPRTRHLDRLKALDLPERLRYLFSKAKGHVAHYARRFALDARFLYAWACQTVGLPIPARIRHLYVFRIYKMARAGYQLQPLVTPVLLFRALRGPEKFSPELWHSVARGGLTLKEIDCEHADLRWDDEVVRQWTTVFRLELQNLDSGVSQPASPGNEVSADPAAGGRAIER